VFFYLKTNRLKIKNIYALFKINEGEVFIAYRPPKGDFCSNYFAYVAVVKGSYNYKVISKVINKKEITSDEFRQKILNMDNAWVKGNLNLVI
jgi:hypothetical protein